ncbi:hypothetical protein GIS00_08420 [Nakamurella sp. YIM 132087]|uniref:Uncharacterized protein n=1 Tax=Nakamurella alba TaxID=2665158 RepID=A0A7K1FIR7_9ACTN|nr:hypothetical protein [Nakamurella alba]MTD13966.1 hypothetical protein [Nakamurella alba]
MDERTGQSGGSGSPAAPGEHDELTADQREDADRHLRHQLRRRDLPLSLAERASLLKERLYGDFACLSSLLVLSQHTDESDGWSALLDLGITLVSLYFANLVAEYVAHLGVHGVPPHRAEVLKMTRAASQIVSAGFVPAILLVLAGAGVIRFPVALHASIWVLVVSLGVFALLTARHTRLGFLGRTVLVLVVLGLGVLAVLLKYLAH